MTCIIFFCLYCCHLHIFQPISAVVWLAWSSYIQSCQIDWLCGCLSVFRADFEPVCRRHHGQLWLSDTRLLHSWTSKPGRVHSSLVRIWPRRHVSNRCVFGLTRFRWTTFWQYQL